MWNKQFNHAAKCYWTHRFWYQTFCGVCDSNNVAAAIKYVFDSPPTFLQNELQWGKPPAEPPAGLKPQIIAALGSSSFPCQTIISEATLLKHTQHKNTRNPPYSYFCWCSQTRKALFSYIKFSMATEDDVGPNDAHRHKWILVRPGWGQEVIRLLSLSGSKTHWWWRSLTGAAFVCF